MIYYSLYFEMNTACRCGTFQETYYYAGSTCYWRQYP